MHRANRCAASKKPHTKQREIKLTGRLIRDVSGYINVTQHATSVKGNSERGPTNSWSREVDVNSTTPLIFRKHFLRWRKKVGTPGPPLMLFPATPIL